MYFEWKGRIQLYFARVVQHRVIPLILSFTFSVKSSSINVVYAYFKFVDETLVCDHSNESY